MCINCHVTRGRAKVDLPSVRTADSSVAEFGIGCEACHGPGERHVDANRNPIRRYWAHLTGRRDSTTVQPATLEPKAASQVCGQCHGVFQLRQPRRRVEGECGRARLSTRSGSPADAFSRAAVGRGRVAETASVRIEKQRVHRGDILVGRNGAGLGTRVQRADQLTVLSTGEERGRHAHLLFVPFDAPGARRSTVRDRMGGHASGISRHGHRTRRVWRATRSCARTSRRTRSINKDRRGAAVTTATCRTRRTAC